MPAAKPRLLLLGCGAFGRVHLAALRRLHAEVTVFDPDSTLATATRLPTASSVEAGIAAADAVIIATPVPTHVPLATAVLRAGRDLFLEKPATETAAQARALVDVAEQAGRIAQVGLYFRFHPKAIDAAAHGRRRRIRPAAPHRARASRA